MQIDIFDRPAVTQVVRDFIEQYQFTDQVKTIDGNYITDSLSENVCGIVFASGTLNVTLLDHSFALVSDILQY